MKTSDDLHKLIKSLSMSEKRYFKLRSPTHKGKQNYIKLFNAIDKQKEYNEKELIEAFKREESIFHLPSEKNYLYNLILSSLSAYLSENNEGVKINNLLNSVHVLWAKGLPRQCLKILKKVKQLATEQEDYRILLEGCLWEKKLFRFIGYTKEKALAIKLEENRIYFDMQRLKVYNDINDDYDNIVIRKGLRVREAKKIMSRVENNELFKNEKLTFSFKSKTLFYSMKHVHYMISGNYRKAIVFSQKQMDLYDTHPKQKGFAEAYYVSLLNNHIYTLLQLKRIKDAKDYTERYKQINAHNNFMKAKVFVRYSLQSIGIVEMEGNYKQVNVIAKEVEDEIPKYKGGIRREEELSLFISIARLYVYNGEYSKVIRWLNKILNYDAEEARLDILATSRILNLIVHYELKNYDLLESIVKSTYRYLDKKKQFYLYEKTIVEFMGKITKIKSNDKEASNFVELKRQLIKLMKMPEEKDASRHFDIISWVESKIEKKKFTDILRKKIISPQL